MTWPAMAPAKEQQLKEEQQQQQQREKEGGRNLHGSCGNIFNYANAGVLLKVFNRRQSHEGKVHAVRLR